MRKRAAEVPLDTSGLPAHLMNGLCIEDWADPGRPSPHFSALRSWQAAVDECAAAAGYGVPGRPLSNARNLARTRRPCSRAYLIATGRDPLADYYDGRRARRPVDV
jgi:hypothetical protein